MQKERWYQRLGLDQSNWRASLTRNSLSVIVLFVVWDFTARFLVTNRLILVPPIDVLNAVALDLRNGELWKNSYVTWLEIVISFPVAVIIGVLTGMVL